MEISPTMTYPGGVRQGTFGSTYVAMLFERAGMAQSLRERDLDAQDGVTEGMYVAFCRDYTVDESGQPRTNYGRVTVHFDGILQTTKDAHGNDIGDDLESVKRVYTHFDMIGVTLQGESGITDGSNCTVIMGGAVNVLNTGRWRINPGDDVYFLLPTFAATKNAKSRRESVTAKKVAILVSENAMRGVYKSIMGVDLDIEGMRQRGTGRGWRRLDAWFAYSYVGGR